MEVFGTRAAQCFFLVVFPAFFAYHALAAFDLISVPLPLGGWWTYANLASATVLVPLVGFQAFRRANWLIHLPVTILVLWVAVCAVWHFRYGAAWQQQALALSESGKLLLGWASLYSIGFLLCEGRWFRLAIFGCLVAMAITAPFLVQSDALSPIEDVRRRYQSEIASYQWFANSVAFTGIMAIALARSALVRTGVAMIAFSAILLFGSRSEAAGFSAVICAWLVVEIIRYGKVPLRASLLFGIVLLIVAAVAITVNEAAFGRYLNALNSASWQARAQMLMNGMEDIGSSPFWGVYAGQLKGTEEFGYYIHNGLSAWRQFGLPAFVVYIGTSIFALIVASWYVLVRKTEDQMWLLTMLAALHCCLLIIAAKSVFWPLPALAWGLFAARKRS